MHVTLRLLAGLNGLRNRAESEVVRTALAAGREREGFRLVHYAILWDHVHLVVEARDEATLAASVKGLCVRMARGLNRLWGRTGRVFADRYHARVLRGPRITGNALRYVLGNARKHGSYFGRGPDPLSSGPSFRHWRDVDAASAVPDPCVLEPAHWLLVTGWLRRQGPFGTDEIPARTLTHAARAAQRKAERRLRRRRA